MDEEKLKKELEEYEKKSKEYLAGWQRSRADFLNYKKEEIERISEFLKYASEGLILELLPILDNFEKAARQNSLPENVNQVIQGYLQIKTQLRDFLKSHGVEEIKTLEEKFDPNFHETVEEVETKDKASGIIIEEIQKGYKINGRLLRPAKVKVIK